MPNYIGAQIIKPELMIYLYADQEKNTLIRLKKVLKIQNEEIPVEAFDFDSTQKAILKILNKYSEDELFLNITGGTKIMALAAFDVAREYAISIIYVNTAENTLIRFSNGAIHTYPVPEVVDVPTYLQIHGHHYLESTSPIQPELSQYIGENYSSLKSILYHLRGMEPNKPYRLPGALSPKQKDFFKRLSNMGLIKYNPTRALIICKSTEYMQFIKGGWLEEFVYLKLKQKNPCDIRLNVKISWRNNKSDKKESKNEFDIMLIHQNQLYIFECKSGKKTVNDIHRLEALREIVGGTYGKAYYVITGKVDPIVRERIEDFKELRVIGEENLLKFQEEILK